MDPSDLEDGEEVTLEACVILSKAIFDMFVDSFYLGDAHASMGMGLEVGFTFAVRHPELVQPILRLMPGHRNGIWKDAAMFHDLDQLASVLGALVSYIQLKQLEGNGNA